MNRADASRSDLKAEPPGPAGHGLRPLEVLVVVHVSILLAGASWAFGGGADWARRLIAVWGSLGLVLSIAAIRGRTRRGESVRSVLLWLCPLAAFNVLVLLSCLNPSFTARTFGADVLLAQTGAVHPQWPSTTQPATSREHLALFDAIYLSCFNLALAIRRRRALRLIFLIAVADAVLLSVLGTFQGLTSEGLFFGAVPAPNARFFATFVYGNHWAAYLILLLAAGLGLVFHSVEHYGRGLFAGSPLLLGLLGLLLMAITPLLAGSRSGTLMVVVLLGAAIAHALLRLRRRQRVLGESAAMPALGLGLCVALAVGAAVFLGHGMVEERWRDTEGQMEKGLLGERLKLYSDTCQLASQHPLFGWGLGSYGQVLQLVRPRPLAANRQYEHSYVDAHSDWLQSWAEVGLVGTTLLILCAAWPLVSSRAIRFTSPLPAYLLGGCALIVLYAGVEFPFGNPAVVVAFWACFFGAIQYVRLSARAASAT